MRTNFIVTVMPLNDQHPSQAREEILIPGGNPETNIKKFRIFFLYLACEPIITHQGRHDSVIQHRQIPIFKLRALKRNLLPQVKGRILSFDRRLCFGLPFLAGLFLERVEPQNVLVHLIRENVRHHEMRRWIMIDFRLKQSLGYMLPYLNY